MNFQEHWDQRLPDLEKMNLTERMMNRLYNECLKSWETALTNTQVLHPNYGWVCPVCGSGNAPANMICHCKGYDFKITC